MGPRGVLISLSCAHLSLTKRFLRYNHQMIGIRDLLTSQSISGGWIPLMRLTSIISRFRKYRLSTPTGTGCARPTTILGFYTIWIIIVYLKAHRIAYIISIKHFKRLAIIKHVFGYIIIDFNKWYKYLAGSLLIGVRAESFEDWLRDVR